MAEIFGLAAESVRVIAPPLGGGYGGKGFVRIEPLVAALARKTSGRPVKIVLSRAEEFVTVTKHAATLTLKTGVRRDEFAGDVGLRIADGHHRAQIRKRRRDAASACAAHAPYWRMDSQSAAA